METTTNNAFEVGVGSMTRTTKVLFGIIGILLITLITIIGQWSITEETLKRRNAVLEETALLFKDVRGQNEYLVKVMKDYKFADYIRKIYEQRDRDFFETATITYNRAHEFDIDPFLALSIIHKESGFNQFAQSSVACGLMQINFNAWKAELGLDYKQIFEKDYNIYHGLQIYKYYLKKANGDPWQALFFYNNGDAMPVQKANYKYPGNVMSSRFMLTSIQ